MIENRASEEEVGSALRSLVEQTNLWATDFARETGRFDVEDLCGGCAIASGYLYRLMIRAGYKGYIAVNEMHCFVVYVNGQGREYILDPTAGQIRNCNPWEIFRRVPLTRGDYHLDWWRVYKRVTSVDELVAYQKRMDWPEEQICPKRFRKVKKVS